MDGILNIQKPCPDYNVIFYVLCECITISLILFPLSMFTHKRTSPHITEVIEVLTSSDLWLLLPSLVTASSFRTFFMCHPSVAMTAIIYPQPPMSRALHMCAELPGHMAAVEAVAGCSFPASLWGLTISFKLKDITYINQPIPKRCQHLTCTLNCFNVMIFVWWIYIIRGMYSVMSTNESSICSIHTKAKILFIQSSEIIYIKL